MSTTRQTQSCNRRQWLGIAAGALAAAPAWAGVEKAPGEHEPQPDLVRKLSPDGNEAAKSSRLVAHAPQLKRDGGYNCAALNLTAAVKCCDLPQKTRDAAAAFGGGVGHGELCGFLTEASMPMGALACKGGGERAQVQKRLKIWNDALWAWRNPLAPHSRARAKPA